MASGDGLASPLLTPEGSLYSVRSSGGGSDVHAGDVHADDGGADLSATVMPRTGAGRRIEATTAPRRPGCGRCEWRPTHARILVGSTTYDWNGRQHRKLRFPKKAATTTRKGSGEEAATDEKAGVFLLWCWEPRVITWYSCWIGIIANTLWVANGVAATWPDGFKDAGLTSYRTGALGAFLFIVTGYLGYVEAFNHTYSQVRLPDDDEGTERRFAPPRRSYGRWPHPLHLGVRGGTTHSHDVSRARLLERGYPLVEDAATGRLLTRHGCDEAFARLQDEDGKCGEEAAALEGQELRIRVGDLVATARVEGVAAAPARTEEARTAVAAAAGGYRWWTWSPDLHHIEVVNALVFFIATVECIACCWT